ncbi:MAG: tetratricopeptide repeat protein [Desulfobulbaceae bacterium]|nr:tetratricopeptide repeat protein [Desulfobulbaceae bacterium]
MKTKILILFILILLLPLCSCSHKQYQMKKAEYLYKTGQRYVSKGEEQKGLRAFERSLALAREAEFEAGVAHNLNEMGILRTARGEYDVARELFSEALAVYRKLEMHPEISKTLNNIALTYVQEMRYGMAVNQYEELAEWDGATGNDLGMAIALFNMGQVLEKNLQKNKEARANYEEALAVFKKLNNDRYIQVVQQKLLTLTPAP